MKKQQLKSLKYNLSLVSLMILLFSNELNAQIQLNGDGQVRPPNNISIFNSFFTPDGKTVVYVADDETDGFYELFSVPADRSENPIKISGTLTDSRGGVERGFLDIQISPDGTRVVYLATANDNSVVELYSVLIDGSEPPVKLSGKQLTATGLDDGDRFASVFRITPDGSRVIYKAQENTFYNTEIYSVPIDGDEPSIRLNNTLGSEEDVFSFQISESGSHVVFSTRKRTFNNFYYVYSNHKLFSSNVLFEGAIRLDNGSEDGGGFFTKISSDSEKVVFWHDDNLSSVDIEGGNLSILVQSTDSNDFIINSTSSTVIYRINSYGASNKGLYSVPINGGNIIQFNQELGGVVGDYVLGNDDNHVYFTLQLSGESQLFKAPVNESSLPMQLASDVLEFELTSDDQHVVYSTNDASSNEGLFLIPTNESSEAVTLFQGGLAVDQSFQLTANGENVIYKDSEFSLFSVTLNGTSDAVQLTDDGSAGRADFYNLSPTSDKVLFTSYSIWKLFVSEIPNPFSNNTPTIADATFSIDENSPVSTPIGTVTVSDPDEDDLTFSIISGNELGAFQIEASSAEITVADSEPLDFETNPTFSLGIQVSDGELSSTATITLKLIDVDESILGTSNEHGNKVRLYPNPFSDFVNVEWGNFKQAIISEISGKKLFKSDSRTIDLLTLNSGVYVVTLEGVHNERITFRIIKE